MLLLYISVASFLRKFFNFFTKAANTYITIGQAGTDLGNNIRNESASVNNNATTIVNLQSLYNSYDFGMWQVIHGYNDIQIDLEDL